MADFISRDAAEQLICETCELPCPRSWGNDCEIIYRLNTIHAADVVARDCYDRIHAENDTMRKQLAQIGKKPGDKMDDMRPVAEIDDAVYEAMYYLNSVSAQMPYHVYSALFDLICGIFSKLRADMRGPNLDTTKGEGRDESSG